MSQQTTTDFEKIASKVVKLMYSQIEQWEPEEAPKDDLDVVTDLLKPLISELVRECIGEDEEEWPEVNTVLIGNSSAMERNEFRAEIRERFKAKGVEV